MMTEVKSLLPPSATPQMRAVERALAEPVNDLQAPIAELWNIQSCPAGLLPWLAWAVSVDVWDSRWPEQVKRDVIATSLDLHKDKGTEQGMRRALAALGVDVTIHEWWEFGGQPFTFRILARPTLDLIGDPTLPFLSADLQDQIERVIAVVKPVRSHPDLYLVISVTSQIHVGAVAQVTSTASVSSEARRLFHCTSIVSSVASAVATKSVSTAIHRLFHAPFTVACVAHVSNAVFQEAK